MGFLSRSRGLWGSWPRFERLGRRVLPRSLLGRSMLIVLLPLLVTQSVALALVYGTYLNIASRRLSAGVASQIAMVGSMLVRDPADASAILAEATRQTQLRLVYRPAARIGAGHNALILGPLDEDFDRALHKVLTVPFSIDWTGPSDLVRTQVQLPGGVLEVVTPRKRLSIEPLWFFVAWAFGSSALLFVIAGLFMRNQVRAIRRLAQAAERFGLGRDDGPIRPQGAREVRQAALAFNRMRERVNRFVTQRTAFLAGVSHDLRTPLTRMRLTVAMIPNEGRIDAASLRPDLADMVADIADMEGLVGSYLSFARGEGAETPVLTDLVPLLEDIMIAGRRAGGHVHGYEGPEVVAVTVRPDAIRRALTNLSENARRHGGAVRFSLRETERRVDVVVEDDGPGLERERTDALLRRLQSGSSEKGAGLGLTIVHDIVRAHGGSMWFESSALGGLGVVLSLPK